MKSNLSLLIKESILISDVIGEYILLAKKGKNFFGLCPFHSDTTPSLVANNDKKIFKCFVCGESGDCISFVMKIKKIPYAQALVLISKKYGIESEEIFKLENIYRISKDEDNFYEANFQVSEIYHNFLFEKENKKILDYLYLRGLTNEDIVKFQIGYAPNSKTTITDLMSNRTNIFGKNRDPKLIWDLASLLKFELINLNDNDDYQDFFCNRIIFPIKNEWNKVVAFSGRSLNKTSTTKYLNSRTSKYFKKDSILYNMENIWNKSFKKLYITEGYLDVIQATKNGLENIVGTMGVQLSISHIDKIKSQKFDSIILAMDNDKAGKDSNLKIGNHLIKYFDSVMVVAPYESKYKDLSDLSNSFLDPQKFMKILNNYVTYIEYVISLSLNDKQIDLKLTAINRISKLIATHGEISLKNYYVNLISQKTGIVEIDILSTIDSYLKNKLVYHNNIERTKIESYLEHHVSNKDSKTLILEKKLIIIMIGSFEVASLYADKLNYMEKVSEDSEYSTTLKFIILILNHNNEDSLSWKNDVITMIKKDISNHQKIIADIEHFYSDSNKSSLISLKISGFKIIIKLLEIKNKNIQNFFAQKIKTDSFQTVKKDYDKAMERNKSTIEEINLELKNIEKFLEKNSHDF